MPMRLTHYKVSITLSDPDNREMQVKTACELGLCCSKSNEKFSLYDNSPPYYRGISSVRADDCHSPLGAHLRLVAFENTPRQGTALLMATGSCNYRTRGSERPGSAFYPVLDTNWTGRRAARPMVTLGGPHVLYCCTMRSC